MTFLQLGLATLLHVELWLIAAVFVWINVRKRRSLPRPCPPSKPAARRAEAVALVGISVSLTTMLMMYRAYDGLPYPLTDVAAANATFSYWALFVACGAAIFTAGLLARTHSSTLACVLLLVTFCCVGYLVNSNSMLKAEPIVEEIRATPVPIEITLEGDVEGADVWFNGEYVGTTPIRADMDELLARVPDLQEPPAEWTDFDQMYRRGRNELLRPLAWFHLSAPTKVTLDDQDSKQRAFYARVELDGQRMYSGSSHTVSGGSRVFGQIKPCYVRLEMILPRWEEHVDLLVKQARLNDYEVDDQWLAVAKTYEDRVWDVIRSKLGKEPRFHEVLDAWARHRYGLDDVDDHASAYAVFQEIVAEADRLEGYHTDSIAGRAVELILPHLDRERIVGEAAERIAGFRRPPGLGSTYGRDEAGRFQFGTYPARHWKSDQLTAGAYVWAHAIWRIDVMLDREDDRVDNLVEATITPALLRLQPGRGSVFDLAGQLGGSTYDRVARPVVPQSYDPDHVDPTAIMYVSGVPVNRDLYTYANLETPAGREFRREHAYQILAMTEKIVRQTILNVLDADRISYLFLDVEQTPDNLAVQFWPRFDSIATIERHSWDAATAIRWHYLARMRPYSTPEMFVQAYRRYCDHRAIQGSHTALSQLEPHFRFEVLKALIAAADECLAEVRLGTSSYTIRQANRDDFVRLAMQVPCEESAQRLLGWLEEDSPERAKRIDQVARQGMRDELSIHQLRKLAEAEDAELRAIVFPSIEARPTPERREILVQLRDDSDAEVRGKANALAAEFDELRDQQVPPRSNTQPAGATE